MVKVHQLEVLPQYWEKYDCDENMTSIRHNDRNFQEGDFCEFQIVDGDPAETSPRLLFKKIVHIIRHEDFPKGLKKDYCLLSLEQIGSMLL